MSKTLEGVLRSELNEGGIGTAVDYAVEVNEEEGYIDIEFQDRLVHLFVHLGSDGRLTLQLEQHEGHVTADSKLKEMCDEIVLLPLPLEAGR